MNIVEIIKKLQDIDIEDLKSLDVQVVKTYCRSNPHAIINAVLVIATLCASIFMMNNFKKKGDWFSSEIRKLTQKNDALEIHDMNKTKHTNFIKNFPEMLTLEGLIDKLSEYALDENVKIISFLPGSNTDDTYKVVQRINLSIIAESYEKLINFIDRIEGASYSIRVESITAKLQIDPIKRLADIDDLAKRNNLPIDAQIKIATIRIKK